MCTLPFLNPGWTTAIMMMMMRMMGNIPAVFQPLLFSHHQYNPQTVWTQPISLIRHPTGWHITLVFFPGFQLATGKKGRFLYYLVKAGGQPALGRLSVKLFVTLCPYHSGHSVTKSFSCHAKTVWYLYDASHILFGTPLTTFWVTLHHLLKWTLIHQYVFTKLISIFFIITGFLCVFFS